MVICTTQIYSVLHSTTKYYSRTTKYYSVLQSTTPVPQTTTPVLLCTTKYYSSTTPYYTVPLQYYKVLLQYYSVLQSTTPVLLRTTQYYSSTTPVLLQYYKVLLQYYSVLQSTTPVLFRTTQYYSNTTPVLQSTTPVLLRSTKYYSSINLYYKVLFQYYSVLQSTTPCYKVHSSTTLYYKVLLQYYSVLHSTTPVLLQYYSSTTKYYSSTTPVLLCTTKYYSSTTAYYTVLLQYYSSTTKYYSSTTLYYKVLLQYYSVLQSTTPVPLCTTLLQYYSVLQSTTPCTTKCSFARRGATGVTLQPHQILRLPRKMTLMIDPSHIWNVIYNARSNRTHPPTSPNAVPATQSDSHDWSSSHMKCHLQCAEQQDSSSNVTKYCTCHVKWLSWLMSVTYETSFTMRGATGVIHQRHQILRLPRKMTLKIHPAHIWNVIYNARSNRHQPPTSPNTAPATQNDFQDSSCSHMKRQLQCAEQQASPSNLTKYCACHAKWLSWLIFVTYGTSFTMRGATGITLQPHQILRLPRKSALQNLSEILRERLKRQFQCAADSTMIRPWSDHDPTMNSSSRTRPFAEVTFRASETHFVLKITTFRAPAIYPNFTKHCACHEKWHSHITKCCACHAKLLASSILVTYATLFTMRGGTGITRQPHQILRLPRKMTLMIDLRHIWNVIYNARSNRHHPPTSPNTAPATQKCTPKSKQNSPRTVEASIPMRGRFDHDPNMIRAWSEHELVISHPPVRRGYFSRFGDTFCIENYNISRSGYLPRFHQILRLPRKVTLQDHQILRLPRKMILMIDVRHIWNVIYNARSNKHHLPSSPYAAPAT